VSVCVCVFLWCSGGSETVAVDAQGRSEQHVRVCESVSCDELVSPVRRLSVYRRPVPYRRPVLQAHLPLVSSASACLFNNNDDTGDEDDDDDDDDR